MLKDLLFYVGNFVAIIGGFYALGWVVTDRRYYGRRRRRGLTAIVFLAVGFFIMASAHGDASGDGTKQDPAPASSAQ